MIKYVQSKPIDYERIQSLLNHSVQAHTFTNGGPVKQLLEKKLSELFNLDSNHRVICTNNGTAALFILLSMYEKITDYPDLKFATPAFNFPAAVVNKLKVEIFDLELVEHDHSISYRIPIEILKEAQHDGYIIPTLFGTVPTNFEELIRWCETDSKILILDNASSPLTNKNGKNINTFGSSSMGSGHHTKYLGFAESGFAVIPSQHYDLYSRLTNFGFDDNRKHCNLASNAKISDIGASFVLAHIETYDVEKHLRIQKKYIEALHNIKGVKVFAESNDWNIVYGNMPVCFKEEISHLVFRDVGIECNKYYKPLVAFPESEKLYKRIINLPLHAGLTNYDLSLILKKVEIEAKK